VLGTALREQAMRDNCRAVITAVPLPIADRVGRIRQLKGLVVSVIFMDLDHFKDVVDTYGHLNGSLTIKEVGQTIQEMTKARPMP